MKITKYPQSCFLIEYKNKKILIDPGSYVYEKGEIKPGDWQKIDILLITHIHPDHCLPLAIHTIAENNPGIKIFSNDEVCKILLEEKVNCESLLPGDKRKIDKITITAVETRHGDLPNGNEGPSMLGFLIDDKVYHPGDAAYLKEKPYAEVALVPICGTIAMNPEEAAQFVKEIKPKLIIPMHYHNPKFLRDPSLFLKAMEGSSLTVKILNDGESIEI